MKQAPFIKTVLLLLLALIATSYAAAGNNDDKEQPQQRAATAVAINGRREKAVLPRRLRTSGARRRSFDSTVVLDNKAKDLTTTKTKPSPSSTFSPAKKTSKCHTRQVRDLGYPDKYRGYYMINGCCRYCRWVGPSGSGGNPNRRVENGRGSWWSCNISHEYSSAPTSGYFDYPKCSKSIMLTMAQEPKSSPAEPERLPASRPNHSTKSHRPSKCRTRKVRDLGYPDSYRGYYKINGCCHYCRWVGDNGSGGKPIRRVKHGSSWWSCNISDEYSSPPTSGYFEYPKCKNIPKPEGLLLDRKETPRHHGIRIPNPGDIVQSLKP